MARGWQPYTPAEGANPDFDSPTVRELHAQGFAEAETCSGTGQGFCSFLFIHTNDLDFPDARLQITTTPAIGDPDAEPTFYDWDMWDYEPTASSDIKGGSPNDAYLEANAVYENQEFSPALYADVLAQEQDCIRLGECANSRYLFEDVLLILSAGEFGSTMMAVVPHSSVSRTRALDYAQMLDVDGVIDFADSILADNYEGGELPPEGIRMTESFFEAALPAEEAAYDRGSIRMVRLISRPDEDISRVEFETVVL
jgi:hypothetical protein